MATRDTASRRDASSHSRLTAQDVDRLSQKNPVTITSHLDHRQHDIFLIQCTHTCKQSGD